MSTEKQAVQDDVMDVVEEKDGSATVELPQDIESPDAKMEESGDADDHDEGDQDDPAREARRARRRAKKEYIRKTNEEKDHRIAMLNRQNQELTERVSVLERRTHGADLARLDTKIEEEKSRLEYYRRKMQEATDNSDGAAFTQAQENWYDSRRKVEAMHGIKNRAVQSSVNESSPAANPQLIRLAKAWMDKNPWYDPEGKDEDSEIAKMVDNRLAQEGWDPASQEYWEEFDKRLQKRIPNRYTNDHEDEPRRRPRSFVTGSSRESSGTRSGGNTFVLEPEQVRAMKDAGLWDDPQKRARMIKRYAEQARNNRG